MTHAHADAGVGFDFSRYGPRDLADPRITPAVVTDAAGRRYSTNEREDQLIIEEASGDRLVVGRRGTAIGEFLCPRGLAVVSGATPADSRVYVCDAWNHRIQIFAGDGTPRGAFGGRGNGAGRFDVPTDAALVWPMFPDETLEPGAPAAALLAVADRWNNRVQVFDLDGLFVASIGSSGGDDYGARPCLTRAGWPFFRVGQDPAIAQPVRLSWEAPRLSVTTATGRVHLIDLALALLPDFDTWRASAPLAAVAAAATGLRGRAADDALPKSVLAALEAALIATRLGHAEPESWRRAS